MDAFDSSEGVVSYGGADKLKRGTRLARLRIDCRMPGQQVGSHLLPEGVHEIELTAKEAEAVLKRAWDSEEAGRVKQAQEDFRSAQIESFRLEFADNESMQEFRKRFEKLLATNPVELKKDDRDLVNKWQEHEEMSPLSMESAYFKRWGTGIPPLRSVEVVKDDIVPTEEREELLGNQAMLASLVKAISDLKGGGSSEQTGLMVETITQMAEKIESLSATVEELEAAATRPKGKSKG